MQVGDLVTLSAAGKKIKGNSQVLGKLGVIVEIEGLSQSEWPIEVRWFNAIRDTLWVKRYEIKKV